MTGDDWHMFGHLISLVAHITVPAFAFACGVFATLWFQGRGGWG